MLVAVHGSRYGYRELKDYVERIEDELAPSERREVRRYGEQKEEIRITSSLQRISQYLQILAVSGIQQRTYQDPVTSSFQGGHPAQTNACCSPKANQEDSGGRSKNREQYDRFARRTPLSGS